MEFKDMFIMALTVGLFAFALISFAMTTSIANNPESEISNDPILSNMMGNITRELNDSSSNTDALRQQLQKETSHPVLTALGFAFQSILDAGTTFISVGVNMMSYIIIYLQTAFTISPVITGGISAIIIGSFILAVWSLIRAGR